MSANIIPDDCNVKNSTTMNKKTLSLLLLGIALLCSCTKQGEFKSLKDDVAGIEERLTTLETTCKEMNTNIGSLQTIIAALQSSDHITGITPILQNKDTIGYTVTFHKSPAMTIYNGKDGKDGIDGATGLPGRDGNDGTAPVISVKMDTDGIYYWTLNGEWLTGDNGQQLPVSGTDGKDGTNGADGADGTPGSNGTDGTTPTLKIEGGDWYVSYNNGQTWTVAGPATGQEGMPGIPGRNGDSFFQGVDISELVITFTLADGTSFTLPRYIPVDITFGWVSDGETGISAGSTIILPYSLSGTEVENTLVTASSDGNYKVKVNPSTQTIEVTAPTSYTDGYVNVMLSSGNGYTVVKVINFYERNISFNSGLDYAVSLSGGEVSVPIRLNFDYSIQIVTSDDQEWITQYVETKAQMIDETLVFNVEANHNDYIRSATISIVPANSNEAIRQVTVTQASATFSISRSRVSFAAEGGSSALDIVSSRGLKVVIPEFCDWLSQNTVDESPTYTLTLTTTENLTIEPRSAIVELRSADDTKLLGKLSVVQAANGSDDPNAMILTVQPLFANDYVVYLPLNSGYDMDCCVDWGDGTVERYQFDYVENNKIFHRYDEPEVGTTFDVKVTGYVPRIYTTANKQYLRSIIAVKQWGNLEVLSMEYAFKGNENLISIPADEAGAFENVTSFSQAFNGCTGLTSIPSGLFEHAVKATDFTQVFFQCESLATIPSHLFENCAKASVFQEAFMRCSSLTTLPRELFYNCSEATNFRKVFSECSNLQTIGNKLFRDCTSATSFKEAFSPCANLQSLPDSLFYTCTAAQDFTNAFYNNVSLTSIPESLFKDCVNATSYQGLFYGCKKITTVPAGLFAYSTKVTSFNGTFSRCSELTSVPVSIFDNNTKVTDFASTFDECGKLGGESPYTTINSVKYHVPERKNAPDYFVTPTKTDYYMYGTKFTDRDSY